MKRNTLAVETVPKVLSNGTVANPLVIRRRNV